MAQGSHAQNTISTYAGGGTAGGAASSVDLPGPTAAIRDAAGNTYIAAPYSTYVFKLNSGTVTTFAGIGYEGFGGDGGAASSALLGLPTGLTIDSKGNIYIADPGDSRVRMVSAATGNISTVAGSGAKCEPSTATCGDGGPATGPKAALNLPLGVAVDSNGNIYIADAFDNRIRAVNMQATAITVFGVTIQPGNIATVAGNGTACGNPTNACGDGHAATAANLNYPQSVALDSTGNLYIADTHDNKIRTVNAGTAVITSIVGQGKSCLTPTGSCGDGGPAFRANLTMPMSVFLDTSNNIYVADTWDQKVRFVNMGTTTVTVFGVRVPPNDIGTVAGNGNAGFTGDNGPATGAELNFPNAAFLDSAGNLVIADTGNQHVRQVVSAGTISSIAGGGLGGDGGSATGAVLANPYNVAEDSAGNIYVADAANNRIRKITTGGTISTVAGTGIAGHTGDGGAATSATLNGPTAVAVDSSNNLYIADAGNLAIRKVDGTGNITLYAGTYGKACPGGTNTCGDGGQATSATFTTPVSVALDSSGNVYIADYNAFRVREVNASTGIIQTIAGNGKISQACPTTPTPATAAGINHPSSVAVDNAGNVYIDNSYGNTICKVSGGMMSNYALNGKPNYTGDGGPALNATQFFPLEIALDPAGNLYIGGGNYNCVRRVDAVTYTIGTVAGDVAQTCVGGLAGDGGSATLAKISNVGLAVDGNSNLYIADAGNNRIRTVHLTPAVTTVPPPNFGAWPIGTTSTPQSATITSAGGVDLSLSSFSLSGNDPSDFAQTATTCGGGTLPASLGVDESCTVTFTFTPQNYGTRTATLLISDNGPNSPQSVTLSGFGPYFSVNASPSSLTINPGSQGNSTLTIAPFGSFTGQVNLSATGCTAQNGLTCTIVPSSVTLDGVHSQTATLTVTVSSTAPPGTRNITALGSFGPSGQLQFWAKMKIVIP